MKSILLTLLVLGILGKSFAQVGINTVAPKAQLDIAVSNTDAPTVLDGLLIPRLKDFSAASPTIDQHGMLVFLSKGKTGFPVGFYFWNHEQLEWVPVSGEALTNFFLSGTTSAGTGIFESVYREGNVGIGADTEGVKLRVVIDEEEEDGTRTGLEVVNASASLEHVTYGILAENSSGTSGRKYGIKNRVSADGSGAHYGVYNETFQSTKGDMYGIYNKVGRTIGVENVHYGIYSEIGTPTGTGYSYGIYAKASAVDPSKVFAGYFEGRLGVGGTKEMEYIFPDARGDEGQILVLGKNGIMKWVSSNQGEYVQTGEVVGNFVIPPGVGTIQVENRISSVTIPESSLNPGRLLILMAAAGVSLKELVFLNGDDLTDTLSGEKILGISGGERLVIQSTGAGWIVVGK